MQNHVYTPYRRTLRSHSSSIYISPIDYYYYQLVLLLYNPNTILRVPTTVRPYVPYSWFLIIFWKNGVHATPVNDRTHVSQNKMQNGVYGVYGRTVKIRPEMVHYYSIVLFHTPTFKQHHLKRLLADEHVGVGSIWGYEIFSLGPIWYQGMRVPLDSEVQL